VPLVQRLWLRLQPPCADIAAWGEQVCRELVVAGALRVDGDHVFDV
jgi:hypothetical protein